MGTLHVDLLMLRAKNICGRKKNGRKLEEEERAGWMMLNM